MKRLHGFSLMEMMIVLTIVAIVAAASAPMVNKKMVRAASEKSPWIFTNGESIAYNLDNPDGIQDNKTARIGTGSDAPNGTHPRLYITTNSDATPHIMFGRSNNSNLMRLIAGGERNNIWLTDHNISNGARDSVAIGGQALANLESVAIGNQSNAAGGRTVSIGNIANATVENAVAIGNDARANGEDAISIGHGSRAANSGIAIGTIGPNNIFAMAAEYAAIAIGDAARALRANSIAIGRSALAQNNTSVAIGETAQTSGIGCVAIGSGAHTGDNIVDSASLVNRDDEPNKIAIGTNSFARKKDSIAIGNSAIANPNRHSPLWEPDAQRAIAIGSEAQAFGADAIAIGNKYRGKTTLADTGGAIALGTPSQATGVCAIAIGGATSTSEKTTTASGRTSIAIGIGAQAPGNNNISIGANAGVNVKGSNKICIGAGSGPKAGSAWANDNYERIFIGGRSKFNDGAAVLEVHNSGVNRGSWGSSATPESTVVINGNLVVKGFVASTLWRIKGGANDNVNIYGRSGGQLEPIDWGDIRSKWAGSELGEFRSFSGNIITSDRRLKNIGKTFQAGLAEIKKLEVFNYTFKDDKDKTPRVGVIAQDLQKVFPDAVVKGEDGFLRIRMEDMFYTVINAIKELDSRTSAQEKKIKELEKRIEELEKRL